MALPLDVLMTLYFLINPDLGDAKCSCPSTLVSGIRILPRKYEGLDTRYLYVCDHSHPTMLSGIQAGYILCVDGSLIGPRPDNGPLYFWTNRDYAEIFNELDELFRALDTLENSMKIALYQGSSLQDILNSNEKLIDGTFVVFDPTFKMLALVGDSNADPMVEPVRQTGYLPTSEFSEFWDKNFSKQLLHGGKICFDKPQTGESIVVKALNVDEYTVAYCMFAQLEGTILKCHTYVFDVLCEGIKKWMSLQQMEHAEKKYLHEFLFADLMGDTALSEEEIRGRAARIGFEIDNSFILLRLGSVEGEQIPFEYYSTNIMKLLNYGRMFNFQNNAYILLNLRSDHNAALEASDKLKMLGAVFSSNGIYVGVSRIFKQIFTLKSARLQADAALRFFEQPKALSESNVYCFYEDIYFNHMLMLCCDTMPIEGFCSTSLLNMLEDDKKHARRNLAIISAYIDAKCELTKAAEGLHIHRNTLIYHLDRLSDKYGINFEDASQRFAAIVTLKALHYLNRYQ